MLIGLVPPRPAKPGSTLRSEKKDDSDDASGTTLSPVVMVTSATRYVVTIDRYQTSALLNAFPPRSKKTNKHKFQ